MCDESAIKEDRNACRRCGSGECDKEIKNSASDVNIRGLFDDKL